MFTNGILINESREYIGGTLWSKWKFNSQSRING